jgi:hypothetical protein
MLADRPFALRSVARAAKLAAQGIREQLARVEPVGSGAAIVFGHDPTQRLLERQRRAEQMKDLENRAAIMDIRQRIALHFFETLGARASLRQLDFQKWETTLLGGILEPAESDTDVRHYEHFQWIIQTGVAGPYVANISRRQTHFSLALMHAVDERRGEDPIELLEEYYSQAILEELLGSIVFEEAEPERPEPDGVHILRFDPRAARAKAGRTGRGEGPTRA